MTTPLITAEAPRGTAACCNSVDPRTRYTVEEWLELVREHFTPETWEAAIAAEAQRLAASRPVKL